MLVNYKTRRRAKMASEKVEKRHLSKHSKINTWLMSLTTVGLFTVSLAQFYLAKQQYQMNEDIAQLRLAEAKPRLKISASDQNEKFGGKTPGSYVELPVEFSIELKSGIDSIFSIDAPITLHISDDNGLES